jgi:hypothetical protein
MTDKQFLAEVLAEVRRARAKFPGANATNAALVEEVGELSKALMYEPFSNVIAEAVQVATMALRLATEGDGTMDDFRFDKFHQNGTRYCLPEHIMPGSKYAEKMADRIDAGLREIEEGRV